MKLTLYRVLSCRIMLAYKMDLENVYYDHGHRVDLQRLDFIKKFKFLKTVMVFEIGKKNNHDF